MMRKTDKQKSRVVANSMLHSLNTAKQHYASRNIDITTAKGAQAIQKFLKKKQTQFRQEKAGTEIK